MRRRLPATVNHEDLVSAGFVGLMESLARFDPERNVEFTAYAKTRIRGAMVDSLRTLDWSPRYLRRMGRAVRDATGTLIARLRRLPDDAEVARELGMELSEYQRLLCELDGLKIARLHAERHEEPGEDEIDAVPSGPEDDSLLVCLRKELRERVARCIDALPERERTLITLRYYEELNLREIARVLGMSSSRASQIHASAMLRLREALTELAAHEPHRRGRGLATAPARRVA